MHGNLYLVFDNSIAVLKHMVHDNRYVPVKTEKNNITIDMFNNLTSVNYNIRSKILDPLKFNTIKSEYSAWTVTQLRSEIVKSLYGSYDRNNLRDELITFYKNLISIYENDRVVLWSLDLLWSYL